MNKFALTSAMALLAGSLATPALADCAAELASLRDGSADRAETGATSSAADPAEDAVTTSNADAIVKDGTTMPLASEHGGGDPDRATSRQDAVAHQDGEPTAAAASGAYAESPGIAGKVRTYEEAVAAADLFLRQGNEDECLAAVQQAQRLRSE